MVPLQAELQKYVTVINNTKSSATTEIMCVVPHQPYIAKKIATMVHGLYFCH